MVRESGVSVTLERYKEGTYMDINKGQELIKTMYRDYLKLRQDKDYLPLVPTCETLVSRTCYQQEVDRLLGKEYTSLSDLERTKLFFLYTDVVVTHEDTLLGYSLKTATQDTLYRYDSGLMEYDGIDSMYHTPVHSEGTISVLEVVPFYFTRFKSNISSIRVSERSFNLANRWTYSSIVLRLVKGTLSEDFQRSEYLYISRKYKGFEGTSIFRVSKNEEIPNTLVPEIRVRNVNDIPVCIDLTTVTGYSPVHENERSILNLLRGSARVGTDLLTTSRDTLERCKGIKRLRVLEDFESKLSILSTSLYEKYQIRRDTINFKSFDLCDSYINFRVEDLDWGIVSFSLCDTPFSLPKESLVQMIFYQELSDKYRFQEDTSIKVYRLDEGKEGITRINLSEISSISRVPVSKEYLTYVVSGISPDLGLQTEEITLEHDTDSPKSTVEEIQRVAESRYNMIKLKGISTVRGKIIEGRTDIKIPYFITYQLILNIRYGGYVKGYEDYEKQIQNLLELNKTMYKIPSHCIKLLCMNKIASVSRKPEKLELKDLVDVLYDFLSLALQGENELSMVYNRVLERRKH